MTKERDICFSVSGEAIPKARARVYPIKDKQGRVIMKNGRPIMSSITPSATRTWELYVRSIAKVMAAKSRFGEPHDGPVLLGCLFYEKLPRSWSKTKKEKALAGEILPMGSKDLSNLIKSVEDAMEGVFYRNDKQIVGYIPVKDDRRAWRFYAEEPRVDIKLIFM